MEFVYVVKRYDLFERRFPHGLELLDVAAMSAYVSRIREHGFFVERRHAERDSSLKQIIPYCVVTRGADVFLMRRLSAGGEARLHGKRSIGVGGHINPVDSNGDAPEDAPGDVLDGGLRREVEEELDVRGAWEARPVGVLNDESTDVGSVHFGLVYVAPVSGDVSVRETESLAGGFTAASELARLCATERDSFESWSALLVDRLDEL